MKPVPPSTSRVRGPSGLPRTSGDVVTGAGVGGDVDVDPRDRTHDVEVPARPAPQTSPVAAVWTKNRRREPDLGMRASTRARMLRFRNRPTHPPVQAP